MSLGAPAKLFVQESTPWWKYTTMTKEISLEEQNINILIAKVKTKVFPNLSLRSGWNRFGHQSVRPLVQALTF